jgi:hypothetical protein
VTVVSIGAADSVMVLLPDPVRRLSRFQDGTLGPPI